MDGYEFDDEHSDFSSGQGETSRYRPSAPSRDERPSVPMNKLEEDILPQNVPVPRSRPFGRRTSSSRRLQRTSSAEFSLRSISSGGSSRNDQIPRLMRQASWYRDALGQGISAENLEAFLGDTGGGMIEEIPEEQQEECSGVAGTATVEEIPLIPEEFGDEELLEQYRIMAHHEARQRAKENLGWDRIEFDRHVEEKRKEHVIQDDPIPKINPPSLRMPRIDMERFQKTQKIHVPLPKSLQRRMAVPRSKRGEDLQKGEVIDEATISRVSPEQRATRCIGCRRSLVVSRETTLVRCPECSTVSPAIFSAV